MRLTVRGLAPSEIAALLRFYEEMYGRDSYQSSRRYFDWLYEQNPAARGSDDCIVALADGNIVGSVHRMRLPCLTQTGPATLTSLQNHVVSPKLRGGAGIMLLQRAVKGERVTLSPGVSGRLSEAYRRLGYDEVTSYWLMRVLNPVNAAFQAAGRTLSRGRWPTARPRLSDRQLGNSTAGPVRVTLNPSGDQLARIAEFLVNQAQEQAGAYVAWDVELVRWRYFSATGPAHVLVEHPSTRAWAIISYGVKSRLNVARLLEHDAAGDRHFMHEVRRAARRIGASMGLAYTTRTSVKDELLAAGWRLRGDPPSSFSFGAGGVSVTGGATDVGFEAFLTETTA